LHTARVAKSRGVPVPLANGDAAAVAVPVAGGTSTTGADVVAIEDEGSETVGVVEYQKDHSKNQHHRKDVSHLRHCYLALALSTPAMNFFGHGQPPTGTSFFTNGRWRSNSGDLLSNSGEGLLRQ
jgi:hypothetical protein